MPARPDLLDNLSEDTRHAEALTFLLDDIGVDDGLSVATGFVNLGGLAHLAAAVDDGRQVRLLIGATPAPALGAQFPNTLFESTLAGLRHDRDLARFPPSRAAAQLAALDTWLDDDHVQVRRYTKRFLHGKAYLFGDAENARAALVTSANLTRAGLFSNLELGLVDYSPNVAGRAVSWFDELWDEAVDFKMELRDLLYPDIGLINPRTVYLRALVERFFALILVAVSPAWCGLGSTLRWLCALKTICRPASCRGRAPAGRIECDLIGASVRAP